MFGGLRIDARHVVMATGAKPNLDVARAAGIAGDAGVDVDGRMATALDGVLAIGDIAHAMHPVAGRGCASSTGATPRAWARWPVPSPPAGRPSGATCRGSGRRSADRDELKYVAWGDGADECVVRRSRDGGFTAWYAKDGATCGVLTYRHDEDNEAASELISTFAPIPRAR